MAHSREWELYENLRKKRPEIFISTEQYEYVFDEDEVQKWEKEVNKPYTPEPTYIIGAKYFNEIQLCDLLRLSDGTLVPHMREVSRYDEKDDSDIIFVIPKVDNKYILFQRFRYDESLEMFTYIRFCITETYGSRKIISCEEAIKRFIYEYFETEVISTIYIGMVGRYKVYTASIFPPEMKFLYVSRFYKKNIPAFVYVSKEELREMIINGNTYQYDDCEKELAALLLCLLHDENS